jgi:CBS domain containing-hemolysin-like protein
MLAVRDANQRLGLELPEDGNYTTIAGFVLAKAGRLLQPGEKIEDAAGVFHVDRVDKRRISRIRFVPVIDDETKPLLALLAIFGVASL